MLHNPHYMRPNLFPKPSPDIDGEKTCLIHLVDLGWRLYLWSQSSSKGEGDLDRTQ